MLRNIFIKKYGEKITDQLFSEGRLTPENIQPKNEEGQTLVKQQISRINEELKLGLETENTNWAFDFSGWINSITPGQSTNKKYLIIGLEPHVERYDFQITYGLSNKTPKGNDRFGIDLSEEFPIRCNDDSSLIWSNLFKILAPEELIINVLQDEKLNDLTSFLNQFYISDLCHFAPQDKAKAIHDVKNWKKIRLKVAENYLKPEIEILKPEIILTQGNSVFEDLKNFLKFKENNSYPVRFGKVVWRIRTGVSSKGDFKIISLPHFGSKLNYYTFWNKNRDLVRNILINNLLLE